MFSSEPINLKFDKIRKTTISASTPYTGVIRLALIPSNQDGNEKTFDSSTGLRRLIYHAATYPIGGFVTYDFHSTVAAATATTSSSTTKTKTTESATSSHNNNVTRHATITFSFATRSQSLVAPALKSSPSQSLLMLALPHHAELLPDNVKLTEESFDLTYRCIKGDMTPVIGFAWSYDEPLYDLEFDDNFKPVEESYRNLILDQVQDDMNRVLPTLAENVYGYGKQVARLAQLAHIADQLDPPSKLGGHNIMTLSDNVLGKTTNLLTKYLEAYLSSNVSDGLLFDSKMGGLVSNNGLHDKGEDFGNGRYNGKPSSFLSNIGLHVFTTNNITFLICLLVYITHTQTTIFTMGR
jgi:endoglucanase Acf2